MKPLTILNEIQAVSAETGISVATLMDAREWASELLIDDVEERFARARLDFEIAEAVTRVSLARPEVRTP